MSAGQIAPAEQVCYVHCNFCNTVLAVSVPGNNMLSIVTVRCGHCTNLLSVNLRGLLHPSVTPATQDQHLQENVSKVHSINGLFRDHQGSGVHPDQFGGSSSSSSSSLSSSSKFRLPMMMFSQQNDLLQEQTLHTRPPEKRQRVPSAYNRFIKEEIRRIKANNPEISHREAFSTAAKNWAHYPNIHFGLSPGHDGGGSKLAVDVDAPPAPKKIHASFCS